MRREPDEAGGQYYRVLPEGQLRDYDGVKITIQPPKEGLDLNRNFPARWRQEHEQHGAGPYPTSEPEVRAMVDFIAKHPNITGGVTFHTYSGGAAAAVQPPERRELRRRGSVDVSEDRREGHGAHGLSRISRSSTTSSTTRNR